MEGKRREKRAVRGIPCLTSFLAYFLKMMPEFIRRMRYSGTAWQVCHASHYLIISRAPSVSCATRLMVSICLFIFLSGNIFRTAEPISSKVCTVTATGWE